MEEAPLDRESSHIKVKKVQIQSMGSRRQIEEAPLDGESSHRQIGDSPTSLDLQYFHHHQTHQHHRHHFGSFIILRSYITMDEVAKSVQH